MRWGRVLAGLVLAIALAGFAPAARAAVFITVDKSTQRMTVAIDGTVLWVWPVSTGRIGHDTPNGQYTAFRMEEDHFSKEWDDAPMPHSIFFTQVGHAIHGTNLTKWLGHPASHGCVRLAPANAALLFAVVKEQGLLKTQVVIEGELPPEPPPSPVAERAPEPHTPALPGAAPRRPAAIVPTSDAVVTGAVALSHPRMRPTRERSTAPAPRLRPTPASAHVGVAPPEALRAEPKRPEPPRVRRARRDDARPAHVRPGVTYDRQVEVVEDSLVNGTWVRRRYIRQARPSDFDDYRSAR
jgi:hypothetical protein